MRTLTEAGRLRSERFVGGPEQGRRVGRLQLRANDGVVFRPFGFDSGSDFFELRVPAQPLEQRANAQGRKLGHMMAGARKAASRSRAAGIRSPSWRGSDRVCLH